jgi:hypothetical protein
LISFVGTHADNRPKIHLYIYNILAYFPGVARVFIYPNLIAMCVPSLAEIAQLDGTFSIITSTLLGGTLPLFPRPYPGIYLFQSAIRQTHTHPFIYIYIYKNYIYTYIQSYVYQVWLITCTLLSGTLPTRRLIYILLHLRTNYMLTSDPL